AGPLALDDERGDPLVPRLRVGLGEDELVVRHRCVRDPVFLAVEDVGVALAPRGREHRGDVRPRGRLGQPEARELLAARLRYEVALLLLFGSVAPAREVDVYYLPRYYRPETTVNALDFVDTTIN